MVAGQTGQKLERLWLDMMAHVTHILVPSQKMVSLPLASFKILPLSLNF
jgi:hypothetical protein